MVAKRPAWAATATLLCLLQAAPLAAVAATERATWVWEADTQSLLLEPHSVSEIVRFARQQRLTALYLYADRYRGKNLLTEQPAAWRRLIRRLHGEGFRVEALLGSAYLHTERYVLPESRQEALQMFGRIFEFNRNCSSAAERFDAIHFDIEPHQLPQWEDDRDSLLLAYLDLGRAVMAMRDELGAGIPVGPDIPFWLDSVVLEWNGQVRSVADHAIRLFDFVSLMDYRNFAKGSDGIIAHAAVEMDIAARTGSKVIVGVETGDGELPKVSFSGRSPEDMAKELELVEEAFRDNPAFAGFAIHHYATWNAWLKRSAP